MKRRFADEGIENFVLLSALITALPATVHAQQKAEFLLVWCFQALYRQRADPRRGRLLC